MKSFISPRTGKGAYGTVLVAAILTATLLIGCVCPQAEPPVKAPIESVKRSVSLPCTYWHHGSLWQSEAALIGRVRSVEVRKDDHRFPVLWRDYILDVAGIAGDLPELKGVTKVHAETLGEVNVGTWVVVYVHYYEDKPSVATMGMDPIVVEGPQSPFPKLLIRKGVKWERFSDSDLEILRRADGAAYQLARDYRKLQKLDIIE